MRADVAIARARGRQRDSFPKWGGKRRSRASQRLRMVLDTVDGDAGRMYTPSAYPPFRDASGTETFLQTDLSRFVSARKSLRLVQDALPQEDDWRLGNRD